MPARPSTSGRRARRVAGPLAACAALAALLVASPAAARREPPPGRAAADRLAVSPPTPARDRALAEWARSASLNELLWLLRHDAVDLGDAERTLVEAALSRAPGSRGALRAQLEARRELIALEHRGGEAARREALERSRPRASVYRVAALLPDRGDYAAYATSVAAGLAAGLAWGRPPGALPIELDRIATGDDEPATAVSAFDRASRVSAIVVGELLSVPTFALAASSRFTGVPLVSPTATDEAIGSTGPRVWAVGPSSAQRALALAAAVNLGPKRRVAIFGSAAALRGPFARAFAARAESLGATIVRRDPVGAAPDWRGIALSVHASDANLLFWDGESRDAESLVRALAAEGVSVPLCGGSGLSPEQAHASARPLFEGATWVGDDWRPPAAARAALDSLAMTAHEHAGSLWVRGFLVGRLVAGALDAGARTPDELIARLGPHDRPGLPPGALDLSGQGATLPVWTYTHGRTSPLP